MLENYNDGGYYSSVKEFYALQHAWRMAFTNAWCRAGNISSLYCTRPAAAPDNRDMESTRTAA